MWFEKYSDFLSCVVTMMDDPLVHFQEPETKQLSINFGSARPKNLRFQKSTGKVLA